MRTGVWNKEGWVGNFKVVMKKQVKVRVLKVTGISRQGI